MEKPWLINRTMRRQGVKDIQLKSEFVVWRVHYDPLSIDRREHTVIDCFPNLFYKPYIPFFVLAVFVTHWTPLRCWPSKKARHEIKQKYPTLQSTRYFVIKSSLKQVNNLKVISRSNNRIFFFLWHLTEQGRQKKNTSTCNNLPSFVLLWLPCYLH